MRVKVAGGWIAGWTASPFTSLPWTSFA